MPHDCRPDASGGRKTGETLDVIAAGRRQGPPRIDVGADGVSVMDEVKVHQGRDYLWAAAYARSPARIFIVNLFSGSGSGHVV